MLCLSLFVLICVNSILSLPLNVNHGESPLFLSQLIKSNQTLLAKESAKVVNLPNAPNITSYAGYLTVNETTNSNLFFWFFPCEVSWWLLTSMNPDENWPTSFPKFICYHFSGSKSPSSNMATRWTRSCIDLWPLHRAWTFCGTFWHDRYSSKLYLDKNAVDVVHW